jgi:hypothetical protein
MSERKYNLTLELLEAVEDMVALRTDLFIAGIDLEQLEEFTERVRRVDLELVKARHARRDEEFYPYYPESYEAESEAYDEVKKLLSAPIPERPQEREGVSDGR